jgi:hypothetical protein
MPSLANHQSNQFTKLLIEGDSKAGKTGALASLVKAGFKLRILDFDNGLDVLKQFILRDSPENLDNVEFRTLRDDRKASAAGHVVTTKAFADALKMLDKWKYTEDGVETDLGDPASWGADCILVIDSLTFLSDAAYDWAESLIPKGKSGDYDQRAVYGNAQGAIGNLLALLTSSTFATNVIVISHVKYVDNPDGTKKGYPVSVGAALSPTIPRYFNTVVRFVTNGTKREIETTATAMFDLANPKPFAMAKKYPVETGLADIFAVLRGNPDA